MKCYVVNYLVTNHRGEYSPHYRYIEAANPKQAIRKFRNEVPTELIGGGRFDSFTLIKELN